MNILKRLSLLRRPSTVSALGGQAASSECDRSWAAFEEPLKDYGVGGYLPITVGDVLASRYRIVRKLGWGVHSTVWLVQDQSHTLQPTFSVLKVLSASVSQVSQFSELDFLLRMRAQSKLHPGYTHVLQLLDHFDHHGSGGRHLCLVLDPMSEDLRSFAGRWQGRQMPMSLVQRIAKQVVSGLEFLHNECNIIHTDIKPANILMAFPGGDALTSCSSTNAGETSTEYGPDGKQVLRTRSSLIPYPLPNGNLKAAETWHGLQVRLADTSSACWADRVSEHVDAIQPFQLRAPEVYVGAGWGKPADIWSLGCTIWELARGRPLFNGSRGGIIPYMHFVTLSAYPAEMVKRGKYSHLFFNDDGSMKVTLEERTPLEAHFGGGVPQDKRMFLDFIKRTLTMDPAERATCQELLAHEWLNADG